MTTNEKVLIKVENLQKSFEDNKVLDGISTEIRQGEVVAVIGPSGSGKSTFLRSLNRLEIPTGGKIYFEGVDITAPETDIDHVRQKIGMVFQQFNLFPHKTVKENIMLAPVTLKLMTPEEAEKKAMELLTRVGLPDKADAYPGSLSGGQKQRIAIARALAMNPDVMLFDEPTSALDPEMVGEVLEIMKKTYKIDVDCANCANKMEAAAQKTAGVKAATVSFMTLKMTVEFEEGQDPKAVMEQVRQNCKKVEDECEIYL